MEKGQDSFIIAPTNIVIHPVEQLIKFSVKNTSTRSSRYEISINDFEHYKTISPRTFTLAPGITKYVKIKHVPSEKCCSFPQVIEVVDMIGTRRFVNCRCFSEELTENRKVQMNHQFNLEKIKTNQEKLLQIPLKNVGSENLKIRLRYAFDQELKEKIQFKLHDQQIILLKDSSKYIKASLKLLKQADFQVRVLLQFLQESTRQKWQQIIKIKGNSLIKSQYIADSNLNKIELISQEMLNGTSFSGSFYLVNNYHIACPFKLLEVVQVSDYKSYYLRCEEMAVKIQNKEGVIPPKGQYKIDYLLVTNPNQNDRSFTDRYSQLSVKDQSNSYKLRNTNFFKKNIDVCFKVLFGEQNTTTFKIKTHLINPALRFTRTTDECSEYFDIVNDSTIEVPFKFIPNLYFSQKISVGKLKLGANQLQIEWKRQSNVSSKTKQNASTLMKCMVKIQIPKNQLILYEPSQLLRPKTALLRNGSISKQILKERISIRAPSKPGDIGIKTITQVCNNSFSLQPLKYQKGEDFSEEQLKFLQINQSEKGNVITNYHKSKNIVIYLPDKGYLYLENQHSYIIPYERKTLKFQFSGRVYQILSRDFQDKNPYKILNKQLIFTFAQNQKEFQIQQQLQILNKSDEYVMVYCLSTDDDYFHSQQIDHKILISPKATASYKISFCPRTQIRVKQSKVVRKLQFLINNQRQSIVCQGQLLSADLQVDEKNIWFKNCIYSTQQVTKKITISNKGLNRINYQINHSQLIKVTPKCGTLQEKSKQHLQISFVPSQLSKQYSQNIVIHLKGSHSVIIPFHINTLQPEIDFSSNQLLFQQGYLNETLLSSVNITNHNAYLCHFVINSEQTDLKCMKNFTILPGETKNLVFQLIVKQAGERTVRLPYNFIQLQGYGILKGPIQYKFTGKKTLLQLIPQNPFQNLVFSQFQEIKPFKIKNISNIVQQVKLHLSPPQDIDTRCILSCQPTFASLRVGQEKQFKIVFIRGDTHISKEDNSKLKYQIKLSIKGNEKYRKFDFTLQIPPPGLQILPKQVYFPLTTSGTWSRSIFKILNRGYKEVLIGIKKPVNVAFQIDYRIIGDTNKLTKLKNQLQIEVFFKSKKPVSFTVNLDIEDNFSKKYCVKLFGTSSLSPLLNCQRGQSSSSSKLFSNKDIKSNSGSFASSATIDHFSSEDLDNVKFINKWLNSSLPDFSKDNENYNVWLRVPKHFMQLLRYLNIQVCYKEENLECIFQELKKIGYPLYTLKYKQLLDGNLEEWSMCIWFLLSKDFVLQDTLKWVSKLCGINVQTYQTAYTHQKKIINDIVSKIFDPIFKGKVVQFQKMIQHLQSSFPILSKIENKRQFILILNILYNKFGKVHRQKMLVSKLQYNLSLENKNKCKKNFWIMTNNSFQFTLGEECYHQKYISQKKLLNFVAQSSQNVKIKFKDNINIAYWSNSLSQPLIIYELQINKKAPNVHNIIIQCENKSTQEWKLNFPCEIESEYFFDFSGGMQFRCKMPDLGVLKAGDIMEFIIVYSPSNLKEHNGVLKISNKYEDHIYNLKGKSLQSKYIELQKMIRLPQGQKYLQTFSLLQDPDACNENSCYKLSVLGEHCEQIKSMQAKSNKKEIIIQLSFQFQKAVQQKQLYLQICNDDMTYCKNIKLIINVIPRPLVIQANLRGVIDKTTVERIPITNPLPVKQNCFVSFGKISKSQYDNFNRYHLEKEQGQENAENGQNQFKISHMGKLSLKPKEKININLSYLPFNLTQAYCQVKIKMDTSQNIIVYNFLGTPQLPCIDNPPIYINCQVDQQIGQIIKVPNRLRDKVTLDVQTNIPFIAGPEQILINSRETYSYGFKMLPLHAGDFTGEIIFKNDKSCLIYPLKITVNSKKKVRKIRIKSKIRVTSTIEIELFNKADRDIEYDVICKSQYLRVEPKFLLHSNLQKALCLCFTPLFVGTKTAELKLYHENLPQINYNLELVSQDSHQNLKINCELGQKKKFKVPIKNSTSLPSTINQPKLPKELSIHLPSGQHFPIHIPAYGIYQLELVFTQYKLQQEYSFDIEIPTNQIGNFNFSLFFKNQKSKMMPDIIIPYSESLKQANIKKETFIQVFNQFDQSMEFILPQKTYQINKFSSVCLDSLPKFQLKPYEKRRIRCDISIDNTKNKRRNSGSNFEDQTPYENHCITLYSKDYIWSYPLYIVKVHQSQTNIIITGSSQELARTRVSLKHIKSIKDWTIIDLPNFKEHFNLSFISSRQVYLQTIFNKPYQYNGHVIFYDENMNSAEKFAINVKIGEKKYEKVWITANVGDKGKVQIKLKNSKGHYKVQLKNNKMKQFNVFPLEGQFLEKEENIIVFEYSPVEYNGNKKAEVLIQSQYGSFNFYLMGRFPPLK